MGKDCYQKLSPKSATNYRKRFSLKKKISQESGLIDQNINEKIREKIVAKHKQEGLTIHRNQ